uniref:Gamma-tubulin complex component 6 n=1 Tax=Cyprinus carpio TaxID=7962 RepID=A0A8C2GAH2_CYPCA
MISGSITGLLGALCDCGLSGLSWKRRALGAASRESARRSLRKRAYGALLAGLFQDGSPKPRPNALANTPAHNKILMISFDLRVSGHNEEAERLEELLSQLQDGADSSGLSELDSVLELLVQLAGSVAPPPLSFSHDYMRRERPVQRRPPLGGYLSRDMQRLEERAWSLICGEEWGVFGGICRTLSIMDAPPGTGLLGLGRRQDTEERFERETRLSLFGALQHSRTADMDVRLDLPPVPSNADLTGLSIRVPLCLDQSDDEGFQSASNLTPDSQSETSPSPEIDVWEALRTFVPGRRRCWENIGCPPGQKDPPYLTEAGREAFDQLYRLWEGEMRNILSTQTPSPLLPLPLDCQSQLVKDVLNVLIGVSSVTFPLNEVTSVQFDVRPDICVSGTSPESVSRLLGELAQYGTHYLRLSRFSLSSTSQKGLIFQAFTGGLRRYLHYYRACVLSTPASLSLLTIACHFRKLGRQLRYLSELCCVDGIGGVGRAAFPVGVKLLSCLYNEAQSNCSNENHPVLLSLLKSSCEPYTRFVSDWVYSGVFRDVYKEFMIEVNEDYLTYRDKNFWTQGYTLISCDAEDCVPVFLKHIANDVYVCGKTINLLKICCPQHYIFWSDVPVPRIAVTFSLQEVEEIERDCAVYRGRMETIARHSAISREEKVLHLMDLITQYSQLSEAAARRELRAMWKVQRMKLDERRVNFLQQEQQNVQSESDSDMRNNSHDPDPALISSLSSSDVCGHSSNAHIKVYKKVSEQVTPLAISNIHGHASDAHIRVGDHVSEVTTSIPTPNIHGHASDSHIRVGEHVSEVTTSIPTPDIHGHASDAHISVGEHVSEVTTHIPTPNIHGHASDSHIRVGEHVSEVTTSIPTPNIHGHASDANIRVGEHVSEVTTPFPTPNIHGHASDSHRRVGEHVSEVTTSIPIPNIHGHASDAHISVGEHVSEVTTHIPTPNIHGHASDSHRRVGEHVSEVTTHIPTPNIHGHASDAHIRVGEHVSEVTTSIPTPDIHGHASDAHIRVGEHVSEVTNPLPTPNIHGHASDAHIRVGEHVSEVTNPIHTANIHGHASDAHIKVGEFVSDVASSQPRWSKYGHSSDTPPSELFSLDEGLSAWALGLGLSPKESPEDRYLLSLALQYQVEQYQDSYDSELLLQVTRGPNGLPVDPSLHRSTDATAVQLNEMMPLPVLMKHSVTTPLITHVSMVNKAVVDYFFVELGVEKHFETLRHFLLMEDGEFALSLSDQLFEKLGSGQTPGELLTPLVLNSILNKALQYSVHGDSELAAHFTFALRYLPEIFHPHAPDSLNCLELRYKVDWPVNIVITDSCLNKYNRLFSFLLQLKHMVWSLRDVWFHLKRTALVKGAGRSAQFHQLQLYRHEMQHFVKVIQGYIANQILQVSWSEFTHKLSSANDLDAIHRTHAEYLNRAIFRGLLTEKAAPVMNIIHSIFSLILKFRGQLIAQPWELQQGEPVHPSFIAMQQSYNTFKYYSRFLFKVVTKLVDKGYQPHLEDFLLRINLNNYYKDS